MEYIRHLYLFRHGKTNAVDENIRHSLMSGRYLTDDGIAEAAELANALADKQIDVFFVSPHERSVHTAKIVAEKHPNAEMIIDERFGDGIFYLWQTDDPNDAVESDKTLARVRNALTDVLKTEYKNIAIASHGGITRAIMYLCGHKIGGIGTGKYIHIGFDSQKWVMIPDLAD